MNLKRTNNANPLAELSSAVRQRMLEVTELEVAGRQAGLAIDNSIQISRALVENSLGLMCIHDMQGDLLYINPAAAQSLGYRSEDGLGRNLRNFLAPAVQHEFDEYLARIKKHGLASGFMRLAAKDGSQRVWLYRNLMYNEPGMPPCVLGHAQDVTLWIGAVKESEQRFRMMADHAPVMIWMTDTGGNFTFFNKQWLVFTQRSMEQATAVKWTEGIHPDDLASCSQTHTAAVKARRPFQLEHRFRRGDGEYRWILNNGTPRFDPSGVFGGYIGSCIDITDRHRMKEELERAHDELAYRVLARTAELETANEQLQQEIRRRIQMEDEVLKAQKIESVGLLAGGIAHDFNNILTVMLGNLSLAKIQVKREDPIFETLNEIEKAGKRATALTAQLLAFAKGGAPVRQPVSAARLITDCVEFAAHGSKVKFEISINPDLWSINVDLAQMSSVLHNVLINAHQAMPDGGRVEVRAENVVIDGETLPLTIGKYVRISVHDNGPGIAREDLARIFDPYFTKKQSGSGLGLATAYAVLTRHQGLITADSTVGLGTTFCIYVPAVEEPRLKEAHHRKRRLPSCREAKVLIMDDEDAIRGLAAKALHRFGFQVECAADGMEAIRLYKRAMESKQRFDVVLLDLTVPGGMSGLETLNNLRALDAGVKAIVASGYSEDPIMSEFEKFGFYGVIKKPWSVEELRDVLRAALSGGSP